MNALFALLVLSFTILLALSLGILAAFSMVNTILYAFGHHSHPEPKPVLLARNAQAGAD